jgi:hypothetical protein
LADLLLKQKSKEDVLNTFNSMKEYRGALITYRLYATRTFVYDLALKQVKKGVPVALSGR